MPVAIGLPHPLARDSGFQIIHPRISATSLSKVPKRSEGDPYKLRVFFGLKELCRWVCIRALALAVPYRAECSVPGVRSCHMDLSLRLRGSTHPRTSATSLFSPALLHPRTQVRRSTPKILRHE